MGNPQNPGWYDDPQNPEQLRYFDGIIWTDHTTPRSTRQAPAQGVPPVQGGVVPPVPPPPGAAQPPAAGWGQAPTGQWGQQPGQQPYGYAPAPQTWQTTPSGPTTMDGERLASWIQRAGAVILDGLILAVINAIVAGYFYFQAFKPLFDEIVSAVDLPDSDASARRLEEISADVFQYIDWTHYAIAVAIVTVVGLIYHIWFHGSRGQTPGKMALGIMVRREDRPGAPGYSVAGRREVLPLLLSVVSNVPVIGNLMSIAQLLNYLWPLWDSKRQALHDKVAGTQVVVKRR